MTDPLAKDVYAAPTAREVGEAHGAREAGRIAALAALRSRLTFTRSDLETPAQLRALAAAHLPVLEAFDADLHAELLGVAAGAGVTPEDVVVLNHYTDLRDVRRPVWGALAGQEPPSDPGGCSVALVPSADGPGAVTGQTWDMHGSAAPFVTLIEPRLPGRPAATLLSLAGCLGMAGMNEEGLAVLINNLTSTDARVGVVWPALVRRLLRERSAAAALEVLLAAPLGSGHHYLLCDGADAYGVETSGTRKALVTRGTDAVALHTNHCFAEDTRAAELVPDGSTTWLRYHHLERRVAALPDARATASQLASVFACHDGYPRSLCIHLADADHPDLVSTCGAVAFDHRERRVMAVRGCAVEGAWVETEVGGDAVRPFRPPAW